MNGHVEEINKSKYLTLPPTNESEEKMKLDTKIKNEELQWITVINTKTSHDYNEKYMKIKYSSDDELSLNKTIEVPTISIVVRAFLENNKYYP